MKRNIESYFGAGRTNDPPEEVQARILYDIGVELERIADSLEEEDD
jgi:hypothetical protein